MEFMSAEHIAAMNAILEGDPAVRAACTGLSRPYEMTYVLSDGPGGGDVHWTITFGDTMRFSLHEVPSADVRFIGDWKQMIRASSAGRRGEQVDAGVTIEGDTAALAEISPVLEVGRDVATMPVDFPPCHPDRDAQPGL